MTDQKYKLVLLPERSVWNLFTGRDGRNFTDGWNACLDAIVAAPEPVCTDGTAIRIGCVNSSCPGHMPKPKACPHCGRKVEVVGDE